MQRDLMEQFVAKLSEIMNDPDETRTFEEAVTDPRFASVTEDDIDIALSVAEDLIYRERPIAEALDDELRCRAEKSGTKITCSRCQEY